MVNISACGATPLPIMSSMTAFDIPPNDPYLSSPCYRQVVNISACGATPLPIMSSMTAFDIPPDDPYLSSPCYRQVVACASVQWLHHLSVPVEVRRVEQIRTQIDQMSTTSP